MSSMSMVKKLASKPLNCTEFQLHKSQLPLPQGFSSTRLLDFTEYKLLGLIRQSRDNDRKYALLNLLADYKAGKVAIAWENGSKPVYVQVTRETFKG